MAFSSAPIINQSSTLCITDHCTHSPTQLTTFRAISRPSSTLFCPYAAPALFLALFLSRPCSHAASTAAAHSPASYAFRESSIPTPERLSSSLRPCSSTKRGRETMRQGISINLRAISNSDTHHIQMEYTNLRILRLCHTPKSIIIFQLCCGSRANCVLTNFPNKTSAIAVKSGI